MLTPVDDVRERLETLLRDRHSTRAFLPKRVPRNLLERIFDLAGRAPSNCNTQPWIVHVVSGEATERLKARLVQRATSGAPIAPDIAAPATYRGVYRDRQIAAAKALYEATGVRRDDPGARAESLLRNYRFFDAPHAAFLFVPGWAGLREAADCGIYAFSLMTSLAAHGLASCAQASLSYYPDDVRSALEVAPDMQLLMGIAFGFADMDHPAARIETGRAGLRDTVIFHCGSKGQHSSW